jgi:hypothetical protein
MTISSALPRFFVPGLDDDGRGGEREYERLRAVVKAQTARSPRARRIFSLTCRLAGCDCLFEVGRPDPIGGEEVVAIIDVGGEQPFSVCTAGDGEPRRLGKHVYTLTEFR